jgi:hypothetical protein
MLDDLVLSYLPTSLTTWLAQTQTFIVALLPQVDASGYELTGADLARTAENGFVVGGVRISQRRAAAVVCPHSAYFGGAYSSDQPCASLTAAGGFDEGVNGFNFSLVAEAGYASEFTRTPLAVDTRGVAANDAVVAAAPNFHHFISAFDPSANSSAGLADLVSWGWVDRMTTQLIVSTSVLFPDLGYVAQLSLVSSLTRGGRVYARQELRSMSLDPYADSPGLAVLDVLVIAYLIYLGAGTLKRAARLCCIGKGATRSARLRTLFSVSTALDWATVAALAAAVVQWGTYLLQLQAARAALRTMPSGVPAMAAADEAVNGSSTPEPTPAPFPPDWVAAHAAFGAASAALASSKTAAVWALIFLSCRIFKYVAFQSRLSVLTDTLWAARDDVLHFGVLFGLLCVFFGYWAYFAFGTQDQRFSSANIGGAALGFVQMVMWDYQYDVFAAADPSTAPLFFVTFMVVMANMALWMWFAVVFENCELDEARAERGGRATRVWEPGRASTALRPATTITMAATSDTHARAALPRPAPPPAVPPTPSPHPPARPPQTRSCACRRSAGPPSTTRCSPLRRPRRTCCRPRRGGRGRCATASRAAAARTAPARCARAAASSRGPPASSSWRAARSRSRRASRPTCCACTWA